MTNRPLYQRPTVVLDFESPEFAGLEVRVRRFTMGQLDRIGELYDAAGDERLANTDAAGVEILELLLGRLVDWNLADDDGTPVPLPSTVSELVEHDVPLVRSILGGTIAASRRVAPPLPQPSDTPSDGLELSMPMAAL